MTRWIVLCVAALLLAVQAPLAAEEAAKQEENEAGDFVLSLRTRWWMPVLNGTYQINKKDIKGSYNDFVDDLDLDAQALDPSSNPGGPEITLTAKLLGLHVGLSYVTFNTGGKTVLEEELSVDVSTLDENDWIRSDLTLAFGSLDIRYDALELDFFTLAFSAGVSYFDFTTAIVGHDTDTGTDVTLSDAGNGFYPVIGAVSEIVLSVLELRGSLSGIAGDFSLLGDIRLSLIEAALSAHLRPVKYVSVGLGFRLTHLDASAVNIWHGDPDPVRFTLYGFFLELELRI